MASGGGESIEFRREPLPDPAALAAAWRRLERVARPSFFTSWLWIGSWLDALPEASRPLLLRGVAAGGETVALALLGACVTRRRMLRVRALHINETGDRRFDSAAIEHNGLLVAAGREAAALAALAGWFARNGAVADELHLAGSFDRFPETAIAGCGLRRRETRRPSYALDLGLLAAAGGDLAAVLSTNARQQLRRALRHYERIGPLRLREAATVDEALAFFAGLKAWHIASWDRRGKPHAFSGPFFEAFHRRLIERAVPQRAVQLLQVCAGDRAIAYLYNFRWAQRVYAYQTGFDYGAGGHSARPGAVAHALAIREACAAGAEVYDFLAGHNRLKASFSSRCEDMLWQVVQQPRLAFRLEDLARRVKTAFTGGA